MTTNSRRASACGSPTVVSLRLRSNRLCTYAPLSRSPNRRPKQKSNQGRFAQKLSSKEPNENKHVCSPKLCFGSKASKRPGLELMADTNLSASHTATIRSRSNDVRCFTTASLFRVRLTQIHKPFFRVISPCSLNHFSTSCSHRDKMGSPEHALLEHQQRYYTRRNNFETGGRSQCLIFYAPHFRQH